jgi:hypothetical protein
MTYACYLHNFEIPAQMAGQCAPWKISNGAENLVLQVLQF